MRMALALLLATASMAGLAARASAADITPAAGQVILPAEDASAGGFDWSGFYAGVHGGGALGKGKGSTDFLDGVSGGLFGVQAGYNVQKDPWVAGFETQFSYSGARDSSAGTTLKQDWLGTAAARIGFAYDKWLFFGKGGAAAGNLKVSTPVGADSGWALGWVAGAGVEYGFTPNLTGRIEYDHVDLGNKTLNPGGVATDVGTKSDSLKAGLNYKF